jgi:hypothetical protein
MSEMGSIYFWRLAHSTMRHSRDEVETKRALGVVRWVYRNRLALEESLTSPEISFLIPIFQAFEVHSTTLTPETYRDQIDENGGKEWKILDEMYYEYTEMIPSLKVYEESDLALCLRGIVGLSLWDGMEGAWSNAKKIVTSDPKIKVAGEEKMTKPEKAYTYLRSQLASLSAKMVLLDPGANQDLQVVRDEDLIKEKYAIKKSGGALGSIPMGIPEYDRYFDPQPGHFVGILGFAGHRKSTLGRTWVYNAAAAGHRVVHYALEMGVDDEFYLYYLMHCRNRFGTRGFSRKDFKDGNMSEEAEDLFYRSIDSQTLSQDLKGEIFYRQRGQLNWFELARDIDDMIEEHQIDMVFCDYLTLVDVPGTKGDAKEPINRMIQSVKPFCESRKVLFVTPIQANREGLNRCEENEGQWDPQGVDTYSAYFKAVDSLIGVYSPKETPTQMILSGIKSRHGICPDPLAVSVCPDTGYIFQ